jgi:hypothetical protein
VRARHPQRVGSLKEALDNTELLEIHSRSFPKPIGRIESLRPVLRFRVFLGGDGAIELEVMDSRQVARADGGASRGWC